ncbi:M15 family metallopeptidase [Bacillus sp. S/N-304-OC-R1]|uniref:M15 family metallopeptidase n=1 Tax=Bacillus sp. S/N-304-OC-R1 TaxID=2758034 RepID=UPI001C8EE65B|nr:M15 family metallopeptidase [Bacillus sp. S/N-304-OC-R1]MBY0123314.1 M15 family metallopeptidase [Bacillus sp. S/N-304-OC-R1]
MDVNNLLQRSEGKLIGVHAAVSERARLLIEKAHAEGIFIIVTQGLRTYAEQNTLYEQGRTKPGKIVTNARGGYSFHNFGLAFDFCVCDIVGGKLVPNWFVDQRWKRAGEIGKSLGLEWGGDWTSFRDYPHFQQTFGLTLAQLRNGVKPAVTKKEEAKKYRLWTGTFKDKQEAEKAAERLRKTFGWLVYVKDA